MNRILTRAEWEASNERIVLNADATVKLLNALWDDMKARKGFNHLIDALDDEDETVIKDEWMSIIARAFTIRRTYL